MSNIKGNKYENSGTLRSNRAQDALWTSTAPVDERGLPELLDYVLELSNTLPFYSLDNKIIEGKWTSFFDSDVTFILAKMAVYDLKKYERKLMAYSLHSHSSELERDKKQLGLTNFKADTLHLLQDLEEWNVKAKAFSNNYEIGKVIEQTVEKIQEDCKEWANIHQDLAYDFQSPTTAFFFDDMKQYLTAYRPGATDASQNSIPDEEIYRFIFRSIFRAMSTIVELAKKEFIKTFSDANHAPQAALVIGFLKLFQYAQQHINQLTKRHLDYYFYKVLGAKPKAAESDHTFLKIILGEQTNRLKLERNTKFFSTTDGVEDISIYSTKVPTVLNQTKIVTCKTLFVEMNPDIELGSSYLLSSGIYVAPDASSKDGQGEQFEDENISWPTLGESPKSNEMSRARTTAAKIGFMISSPILFLSSGKRIIQLFLGFQNLSFQKFRLYIEDIAVGKNLSFQAVIHQLFAEAFDISISHAEGWITSLPYKFELYSDGQKEGFKIEIALAENMPAIAPYQITHQGKTLEATCPSLKILLRSEENIFVYSLLEVLLLEEIDIAVDVKGLKNLKLFNEIGQLNPTSPFLPFGPFPKRRSYLLFGSDELKKKQLTKLSLFIDWFDLPDLKGGFDHYYESYPEKMTNESFKINLSALSNYQFFPLQKDERQVFHLFEQDGKGDLYATTTLDFINIPKLDWTPDYAQEELLDYSMNVQNGYFRIELIAPNFAFGHSIYPQLFAEASIKNARTGRQGIFSYKKEDFLVPFEPYTPKINRLTVDYSARTSIQFHPLKFRENDPILGNEVFLLHPFGIEKSFDKGIAKSNQFLPSYKDQGNLFIGLEGKVKPQMVRLFFKLKNSQQKKKSQQPIVPKFYFLSSNKWISIAQQDILSDGTQSFSTSGIIALKLGKEINTGNTILEDHLYWIKVTIAEGVDQIGETQILTTNTVKVFWDVKEEKNHFKNTENRLKIEGLLLENKAIEEVVQLTNYIGGKPQENQNEFYTRVSERLRHKGRATTKWDYEHLVLEAFPEIKQVKCINYHTYKNYSTTKKNLKAGKIIIVIVPRLDRFKNQLEGDAHLLDRVKGFLLKRSSPFVEIEVMYPVFEQIKLNGLVKFKEADDVGIMLENLQDDMKKFISPWLQGGALPLGETLNVYEVYRYIETLPYVSFFTQFSVLHIFEHGSKMYAVKDSTRKENFSGLIQPDEPWSTIIPLAIQGIQITEREEYSLPRNHTMESMYIDNDSIISADEQDLN